MHWLLSVSMFSRLAPTQGEINFHAHQVTLNQKRCLSFLVPGWWWRHTQIPRSTCGSWERERDWASQLKRPGEPHLPEALPSRTSSPHTGSLSSDPDTGVLKEPQSTGQVHLMTDQLDQGGARGQTREKHGHGTWTHTERMNYQPPIS